jgi:hypothetical protein
MSFRSPSLLQLSYALALQMRQLATTHLATASAGTKRQARLHNPPSPVGCGEVCRSLLCQNYKAAPSKHNQPPTPLICATYRRSAMPPCKGTRCRTRSMQGRDPCRSRLMQNATMRIPLPCRSRPMRIVTHADRDPKAYASVVSTTTPAPKGRNSLAQGVSPGTRPTKSRAPEGRQPLHPPISTSSPPLRNIDIHKYRYQSI